MNGYPEPTPASAPEEDPMWESDAAQREAKRRKLFVFGGSAVAVLVGFVGLYAALSWVAGGLTSDPAQERTGPTVVNGEGPTDAEPPPSVAVPVANVGELDWYAVEAPLGHSERLFATDAGTFYALSTVPGQSNNWPIPKAIYKSGDGENWEVISLDNNISANDMALGNNTLYLIGTSPGSGNFGEAPEIMISTTSDDGNTWTQSLLPTVAAPPGGAAIEGASFITRIAANNSTVVAVAQSQFFLDYRSIVPAEFSGDMFGYSPTADGVSVKDYQIIEEMYQSCEGERLEAGDDFEAMSQECQDLLNGDESVAEIGFVTWEDMGLPEGGQPAFSEMFLSLDGTTFEALESPFAAGADLQGLYALPNGFVGVEWNQGVARVWQSDDGRSWVQADDLPRMDWITNVGAIGDKTIVVGQSGDSAALFWENDAAGWDRVDFDTVVGVAPGGNRWLSSAGIGPMGVVAVFQTFDERVERESTEVLLGTSPQEWSVVPLEEITGMVGGYSSWVVVGADRILIRYDVFNQVRPLSLQVMGVRTN